MVVQKRIYNALAKDVEAQRARFCVYWSAFSFHFERDLHSRRQGGFSGDLSWQLNKDLHNISSDIFQILFDFYFLIFFYCQLRHSALPCEGTRGAAHKVSSHCYFGGNNMNIYVENIVFEVKLRIFLLTILNILGWEIVSEVKLGIFFVESNEFSFRK